MALPVSASDHHFGRIGEGDAAVITVVLLDTNRQQATIISLLSLFHAGIQSAHRRILEINEVSFVDV
jgi:Flp pilus assembly protein protease CpaA